MIVRITYTNGDIQIVQQTEFVLAPGNKMRPDILKAEVFADNGKRLNCVRRKHIKKRKPEEILRDVE